MAVQSCLIHFAYEGIHATKPVTGHSCLRFMPSDFELVGSGEAACRGDFWYDAWYSNQIDDPAISSMYKYV